MIGRAYHLRDYTMNPLISVITVTYNSEKTIRRTIESVLAQTYDRLEYILVDGCSDDSTVSIVRKYETGFAERGYEIRIISEPDRGMYDAMNKGIHMASGDILGILNSDDWYEPDALRVIAEAYLENDTADIIMGSIRIHNGNRVFIKQAENRHYRTSRDFNHPAMFVTSVCYADVGDYGIDNVHDDYGWFLKAVKQGKKLVIVDEVITNYPTGGTGSVKSLKNTIKRIGTKYKVYKDNGYSKLYYIECVVQELGKYLLLKR